MAGGCTGLLSQPDFWEKEGDASILKFNRNDWLQGHTEEAVAHATRWLSSLGVRPSTMELDRSPLNAEGARIFRADANRTFRSEPNRELFIKLLSFAQSKFGDYQQSMGYVAGVLLLFFDPATVFKALTVLNDHPRYLPGYWRGEATACAVDGYVCFRLLRTVWDRQVLHDKLLSLGLMPETFVQKWFAGLCIHHLPYHLLVHFLDHFFAGGNLYLFQFFGAFMLEFEEDLMSVSSNPPAFQLLRFETAPEVRLQRVVEAACLPNFVEPVKQANLNVLRCEVFEENLSRRLQSANEGMWQKADESDHDFSDEDY